MVTKNPIIWLQYLCWNIQFWMDCHKPYYPDRLRFWLRKHYPDTSYVTQWYVDSWKEAGVYNEIYKPWPWYVGEHCFGPFLKPWSRVAGFFRRFTGGRSHRCEFTDRNHGALYGHREGPFMGELFEQFIKNISDEEL